MFHTVGNSYGVWKSLRGCWTFPTCSTPSTVRGGGKGGPRDRVAPELPGSYAPMLHPTGVQAHTLHTPAPASTNARERSTASRDVRMPNANVSRRTDACTWAPRNDHITPPCSGLVGDCLAKAHTGMGPSGGTHGHTRPPLLTSLSWMPTSLAHPPTRTAGEGTERRGLSRLLTFYRGWHVDKGLQVRCPQC